MISQIIVLGSGMVGAGAIHWHRHYSCAPIAVVEPSIQSESIPYT